MDHYLNFLFRCYEIIYTGGYEIAKPGNMPENAQLLPGLPSKFILIDRINQVMPA